MRAGLALAATTLVASPVFAANEEWPSGPKNEFFRALGKRMGQRTDASKPRQPWTGRRRLRQGEQPTRPFRASAGPL